MRFSHLEESYHGKVFKSLKKHVQMYTQQEKILNMGKDQGVLFAGLKQMPNIYNLPRIDDFDQADHASSVEHSWYDNNPPESFGYGSTCTKENWDRGSWDLKYSWTTALNRHGYTTLAVDELGNGASSHPDPVYDVQLPLKLETVHSLIMQIKSGNAGIPVSPKLSSVSHSFGWILNPNLARTHPNGFLGSRECTSRRRLQPRSSP